MYLIQKPIYNKDKKYSEQKLHDTIKAIVKKAISHKNTSKIVFSDLDWPGLAPE